MPNAQFELRVLGEAGDLDEGEDVEWVLTNTTMLDTAVTSSDSAKAIVTSDRTIDVLNEQLILQWGLGVTVHQTVAVAQLSEGERQWQQSWRDLGFAPRTADDAQCGANASCKAIQSTGICTYDDLPVPPSSPHFEYGRDGRAPRTRTGARRARPRQRGGIPTRRR